MEIATIWIKDADTLPVSVEEEIKKVKPDFEFDDTKKYIIQNRGQAQVILTESVEEVQTGHGYGLEPQKSILFQPETGATLFIFCPIKCVLNIQEVLKSWIRADGHLQNLIVADWLFKMIL